MSEERDSWNRIQSLFDEAVGIAMEDRGAFLDRACEGDPQLRDELESLLASVQPSEKELEVSPLEGLQEQSGGAQIVSDAIPGYKILRELHRGGQGVVYQALQLSTKRKVAIKVMLEGPFAGAASKRRFEREIELVGSLRHPNIVAIFDSGVAQGQYYYAMEYIRGKRLDEYIKSEDLSVNAILALFARVCHAIDYAHQKGVIHRDLKPSNILIDIPGEPHVLDFGLAKMGAESAGDHSVLVSVTGQIMGTLTYMSPEQAAGQSDQVDMRSDVYALGIVLYELLSDELPYELNSSMAENLVTIQKAEPKRITSKRRGLNDEVGTIVLKAISKEKQRRYPTAGAFGEDIQRYLSGDPIEAKRDSAWYVVKKTLRRNLMPASVVAAFLALLVVASVVSTSLYWSAQRSSVAYRDERDRAQKLTAQSQRQLYVAEMNLAGQALSNSGGVGRIKELTARWHPDASAGRNLQGWEWYYLNSLCDREHDTLKFQHNVTCVRWSPDHTWLAVVIGRGHVYLCNPHTSAEPVLLGIHDNAVRGMSWSDDGLWLATGSANGSLFVWNVGTREKIALQYPGFLVTVCWQPGKHLVAASGRDGLVQVWDIPAGNKLHELSLERNVTDLAWTADGEQLAAGCSFRGIELWDIESNTLADELEGHAGYEISLRVSPDGNRLASCCSQGEMIVWDLQNRQRVWSGTTGRPLRDVTWSPDGQQIAAAGDDRAVRVWNASHGDPLRKLEGHTGEVWHIDWSPDGAFLASGAGDETVRIWDATPKSESRRFRLGREKHSVVSIAWSPDGRRIAGTGNPYVAVLDADNGEILQNMEGHGGAVMRVDWSPDGRRLATSGWDSTAMLWDVATGKQLQKFLGHQKARRGQVNVVHAAAWSPDGTRIASISHDGMIQIWNAETIEVQARYKQIGIVRSIDWHPDGDRLVFVYGENVAQIWNPHTNETSLTLTGHTDFLTSTRWSPDGTRIATASNDGTARIWNGTNGQLLLTLKEHVGSVTCADWSPDGTRLATSSRDRTVRIWDTTTGAQTLLIDAHKNAVTCVAWSPDGKQLASSGEDAYIGIWDASLGYERTMDSSGRGP